MRIITSTRITEKYGPGVLDIIKKLGPDVDVLDRYDFNHVKCHIDDINDDILIFGGPDVIPFGIMANPASDPDTEVQTDNPYACTKDPTYLIPDKVVGRLPDEQLNWNIDFIQAMVDHQLEFVTGKSPNKQWFNIVASVWKGISDYMHQAFKMTTQNVVPPTTSDTLPSNEYDGKLFSYINLHGTKQTPYYYGQQGGNYPVGLKPVHGAFKGGLVFAESCYGSYLNGRDRTMSIPLMALFSGCIGFVGSTETAYGPPGPPARAADLLAQTFYNRIISGETLGRAFLFAKQDFATQTIQQEGALDPEAKKTLLEFVLFGNPSVVI